MTVELDEYTRIGDTVVAALVSRSVSRGPLQPASFFGTKHPVAILIHRNVTTTAYEPDGAPIPLAELDRRYPGQRVEFERQAARSTDW